MEWLEQQGSLHSLSEDVGHVQAPPVVTVKGQPLLQTVQPGCVALLAAFRERPLDTVDRALALITSFIEPFDVLLQTLELAVSDEAQGIPAATKEVLGQLPPLFRVDLLCNRGEVLPGVRVAAGFTPAVQLFPLGSDCFEGKFVCIGECSSCQVARTLSCVAPQTLPFVELEQWNLPAGMGLSASVPMPPLACRPFWHPSTATWIFSGLANY